MKTDEVSEQVFLSRVFELILGISKGKCDLDEETILATEGKVEKQILQGLLYLYEDLELYKVELRNAMEAEYQLKVLEDRNRQLEHFTYVASHDLKEPLRTIKSFSSLLQKQYQKQLDDNASKFFDFITKAAHRMDELIAGLLLHSRIGAEIVLEKVDCDTLVNNVIMDIGGSINNRSAIIQKKRLPTINAYRLELGQVFLNLITNGLKFQQPGNQPIINISFTKDDKGHTFCIKDNGIGFEDAYAEKIFIIFKRLHTRSAYEGTGIGLANCKKIIEMHNGKIWVKSTPGKGSSFFFFIPYL